MSGLCIGSIGRSRVSRRWLVRGGLFAPPEWKNGWTPAEEAGHAGFDRIRRLLYRIDWKADEVVGDGHDYVVEHLADREAALIVDDTGFLKKGSVRPGCGSSIPAPRDAPRTARSVCSSPAPPSADTR